MVTMEERVLRRKREELSDAKTYFQASLQAERETEHRLSALSKTIGENNPLISTCIQIPVKQSIRAHEAILEVIENSKEELDEQEEQAPVKEAASN